MNYGYTDIAASLGPLVSKDRTDKGNVKHIM